MTNVNVKGGLSQDNAILLLAAVETMKGDPSVVVAGPAGFIVPKEVADKAGVEYDAADTPESLAPPVKAEDKAPAKKASAKKATPKKAASKKAAPKKDQE